MQQRRGQLEALLEQLAGLLGSAGETHWLPWAERGLGQLRDRDWSGVDTVLAGFGGMGSLNDLVLHPANGHAVAEEDVAAVNSRLQDLRTAIWREAVCLRHLLRAG